MTPIERLQFAALSYQVYPCDREVVIRAHLDTALYHRAYVDGRGQTTELAAADAADQAEAHRNDVPRLVSITTIAERSGWLGEGVAAA